MGLPILNRLLPQGLLVEQAGQPPFSTFLRIHPVLDMVAIRLALHPILTQILLDQFSRCQVFHRKNRQISIIIVTIHYVLSFFNVDTDFP